MAEKIRDRVLGLGGPCTIGVYSQPQLNEESKITILTYESMWEMRPLRDLHDFLGAQDIKITLSKAPYVPSLQAVRTLQTGRRKYVPRRYLTSCHIASPPP